MEIIDKVQGAVSPYKNEECPVLVNTPSLHTLKTKITGLSLKGSSFLEISRDDKSKIRVVTEGDQLIKFIDDEGHEYPSVRFDEVYNGSNYLLLKLTSGDLVRVVKVNSKYELPKEVLLNLFDSLDKQELVWSRW